MPGDVPFLFECYIQNAILAAFSGVGDRVFLHPNERPVAEQLGRKFIRHALRVAVYLLKQCAAHAERDVGRAKG